MEPRSLPQDGGVAASRILQAWIRTMVQMWQGIDKYFSSFYQQVIEFSHNTNDDDSSRTILALLIFGLGFDCPFISLTVLFCFDCLTSV